MEAKGGGKAGDSGANDDDILGANFFHGALMILESSVFFILAYYTN